jgi:hypothetical protein
LLKTVVTRIPLALLLFGMLPFAHNIRQVEAQTTAIIERMIFSLSPSVDPNRVYAPYTQLDGGANVRIKLSASEPIDFFCQNVWEYSQSNSTGWHNVTSYWSNKTAFMDKMLVVPTTGDWYFTLVNYEPRKIYVDITLYRLETFEIHVASSREFYGKWEQATLTARVDKDSKPVSGLDVQFEVSDPYGNVIFTESKQTNALGQASATFALSDEEGTYSATAQTTVVGKTIDDLVYFSTDTTPPTTLDDYDETWHSADFNITLTALDNESGVSGTYYRINNGPNKRVAVNGQPFMEIEGVNNKLEYWSRDNAGNEENHHLLNEIRLDKTAPNGSIIINNGDAYTNSTSAALTLTAVDAISGVFQVGYSNDGSSNAESWEPPSATRKWNLTLGDGIRTVYYQIEDNARLVSITYSNSITLDTESPIIGTTFRTPSGDVQPDQQVKVSVNATDSGSGVKSVRLRYHTSADSLWFDFPMSLNSGTGFYEYTIPGKQANTSVEYEITVGDYAGNEKNGNMAGQYYVYRVVPEFPSLLILPLFIATTFLATCMYRKRRSPKVPANGPNSEFSSPGGHISVRIGDSDSASVFRSTSTKN